jgi:hypothetical protein
MTVRRSNRSTADGLRRIAQEFRQTPAADRGELLEAFFWLWTARQVLQWVPFPRLAPWLSRGVTTVETTGPERLRLCRKVRGTVLRAARCLPGRFVCFPRALAAQRMLRRRRIGTELYYGAAVLPDQGLKTHVWLQDGPVGVVGYRAAERYRVLACYSSHKYSSSRK